MNSNKKMLLTVAVVAILGAALAYAFINGSGAPGTANQNNTPKQEQVADNSHPQAPDFALQNLAGEDVKLSDYQGKVVFVNFWATWCGPCRQEIPHFVDLVEKYENDGFTVLGIALDPREFDKVPGFVDQMGINYPVLLDKSGVSQLYGGIRSIPTTFVVNREGKVVDRIVGSRSLSEFDKIIASNL